MITKKNSKLSKIVTFNKGYKSYMKKNKGFIDISLARNQVSGTMFAYDLLKRSNSKFKTSNTAITTVQEYLDCIDHIFMIKGVDPIEMYNYRGQVDSSWGLTPSIVREISNSYNHIGLSRLNSEEYNNNIKKYEISYYNEFLRKIGKSGDLKKLNKDGKNLAKTDSNWFALMQHMGYPTRLIDITRDKLIALYFACVDWNSKIDVADRSYTDGAVFIIKNVFHLDDERRVIKLNDNGFTTAFHKLKDYEINYVIEPTCEFRRIEKQESLFITQKNLNYRFGLNSDFVILVDGKSKSSILEELNSRGINQKSTRKMYD